MKPLHLQPEEIKLIRQLGGVSPTAKTLEKINHKIVSGERLTADDRAILRIYQSARLRLQAEIGRLLSRPDNIDFTSTETKQIVNTNRERLAAALGDLFGAEPTAGTSEPIEAPLKPMQYQLIELFFRTDHNIGMAFPTGTGKTRTFLEIASRQLQLKPHQIIVITTPTNNLIHQINQETSKFTSLGNLSTEANILDQEGLERYHEFAERLSIQEADNQQNPDPQASQRVIIGTPHRIQQLIDKKVLNPQDIGLLILDEGGIGAKSKTWKYPTFEIYQSVQNAHQDFRVLLSDATPELPESLNPQSNPEPVNQQPNAEPTPSKESAPDSPNAAYLNQLSAKFNIKQWVYGEHEHFSHTRDINILRIKPHPEHLRLTIALQQEMERFAQIFAIRLFSILHRYFNNRGIKVPMVRPSQITSKHFRYLLDQVPKHPREVKQIPSYLLELLESVQKFGFQPGKTPTLDLKKGQSELYSTLNRIAPQVQQGLTWTDRFSDNKALTAKEYLYDLAGLYRALMDLNEINEKLQMAPYQATIDLIEKKRQQHLQNKGFGNKVRAGKYLFDRSRQHLDRKYQLGPHAPSPATTTNNSQPSKSDHPHQKPLPPGLFNFTTHLENQIKEHQLQHPVVEQLQHELELANKLGLHYLIFYNDRAVLDNLQAIAEDRWGLKTAVLHGGASKTDAQIRSFAIQSLKQGQIDHGFATSVAERGLDISNVDGVIVLDPTPDNVPTLMQKAGRIRKAGNVQIIVPHDRCHKALKLIKEKNRYVKERNQALAEANQQVENILGDSLNSPDQQLLETHYNGPKTNFFIEDIVKTAPLKEGMVITERFKLCEFERGYLRAKTTSSGKVYFQIKCMLSDVKNDVPSYIFLNLRFNTLKDALHYRKHHLIPDQVFSVKARTRVFWGFEPDNKYANITLQAWPYTKDSDQSDLDPSEKPRQEGVFPIPESQADYRHTDFFHPSVYYHSGNPNTEKPIDTFQTEKRYQNGVNNARGPNYKQYLLSNFQPKDQPNNSQDFVTEFLQPQPLSPQPEPKKPPKATPSGSKSKRRPPNPNQREIPF